MAPFHTFIEKCRTYESDFDNKDWDARDDYCIKIIGGAQKLLSLFGLQWFCDDEPFDPIPKFDRAPRRDLLLDGKSLLDLLMGLSPKFLYLAVSRSGVRALAASIESLCQVSRQALDDLILQLQKEISTTPPPSNSNF